MISRASGIHWSKQPFANANSGYTTRSPGNEQRIALPLPRGVVSPTFSRWVSCFAGSISRGASALAAASITASFCHKIQPELDYLSNTAKYRSEREHRFPEKGVAAVGDAISRILAESEFFVSVGHEIAFAVHDDRGAFNPFRAVF